MEGAEGMLRGSEGCEGRKETGREGWRDELEAGDRLAHREGTIEQGRKVNLAGERSGATGMEGERQDCKTDLIKGPGNDKCPKKTGSKTSCP